METFIIVLFSIVVVLNVAIVVLLARKKVESEVDLINPDASQQERLVMPGAIEPTSSDAVVAAIIAAITLYLESESIQTGAPRAGFVVKKISKETKIVKHRGVYNAKI
ncbi:MAG: hypothetical protein LBE09_08460 [Christensenellaceae bacterium]|nr:hypothetical protein [Christensenellaceae bacterium]